MAISLATNISATIQNVTLSADLTAKPGDLYRLGDECVQFSGYQGNKQGSHKYVVLLRGREKTTAASHLAGVLLLGVNDAFVSGTDQVAPGPFNTSGAVLPIAESDVTGLVDALATLAAASGTLLAYDEFSRHANGALSGKVPVVGSTWVTSGAQLPTVASGLMGSSGTGYAFQTLADPAAYLECVAIFSGTDDGSKPMTMAWVDAGLSLGDVLHMNFGETGFVITVRKDAGTFYDILDGDWRAPVVCDGVTPYKFGFYVRGDSVTVVGPHGETFSTVDVRVAGLVGSTVFWEPGTNTTNIIKLASVRAIGRSPTELDIDVVPSFLDASVLARLSIDAARDTFWQMTFGRDAVSGLPALFWGPTQVRTYLTAAASIGAGTIVTHEPLLAGTTIVDFGDNEETVTTVGISAGTGPYTATLVGTLAKNHAAGIAVTGSAGTRPSFSYNPSQGWLTLNGALAMGSWIKLGQVFDANFAEILSTRKTGWTAATGDALRTTFATSTVSTEELAKRVKALIDDLIAHGLIGA